MKEAQPMGTAGASTVRMIPVGLLAGMLLALFVLLGDADSDAEPPAATRIASIENGLDARGLRFIENRGQAGPDAKFHTQGAAHTVLFDEHEIRFRQSNAEGIHSEIVLEFIGAGEMTSVAGRDRLPGVAHFYRGASPTTWFTDVPTFAVVHYTQIYENIDLAFVGTEGLLKSEFHVSPRTNADRIRFRYRNARSVSLSPGGHLQIESSTGMLIDRAPFAFQTIGGERVEVAVRYVLHPNNEVGFRIEEYDDAHALVIDPELVFSTILDNVFTSVFNGVDVDADGNQVLAGFANRFFPTTDVIPESNHAGGLGNDGLLVKLDGSTGDVIYSALFGGSRLDNFRDVAVGPDGDIHLTGLTASDDFPTLNPVQANRAGQENAVVVILNSEGVLQFSTYLGGSERDWGVDLALDETGGVYVSGRTESADFPFIDGFQQVNNGGDDGSGFPSDLFVVKFNQERSVGYATYLGGTGDDDPCGLVVNSDGGVTVASTTTSADFPVANAYQAANAGGESDVVVSRLNAAGSQLLFSTYVGGAAVDACSGMASGSTDTVVVSGSTTSNDFPVIGGDAVVEADESDGTI
ncbi:MAG: hypothetical protein HKN17_08095, partial [Rhodothermales bacterium]|nr:hypothetical protein [Rhodothermales bacterium]